MLQAAPEWGCVMNVNFSLGTEVHWGLTYSKGGHDRIQNGPWLGPRGVRWAGEAFAFLQRGRALGWTGLQMRRMEHIYGDRWSTCLQVQRENLNSL